MGRLEAGQAKAIADCEAGQSGLRGLAKRVLRCDRELAALVIGCIAHEPE